MKSRICFALLAMIQGVACAEPPASAATCIECHGAAGIAVQPKTPHLNGQLAEYLVDTMAAFAAGSRPTAVAQHKTFAAADAPAMAAFYAGQKGVARPVQATDAALAAKGEKLYNDRCVNCHVDNGRDSDKEAPLLAAQEKESLLAQTLAFKAGRREFPMRMDNAYRDLSDEDLAAIVEFFVAQPEVAPGKKKRRR
jgi:sulfide dehydrogenase cytochrome subunit